MKSKTATKNIAFPKDLKDRRMLILILELADRLVRLSFALQEYDMSKQDHPVASKARSMVKQMFENFKKGFLPCGGKIEIPRKGGKIE